MTCHRLLSALIMIQFPIQDKLYQLAPRYELPWNVGPPRPFRTQPKRFIKIGFGKKQPVQDRQQYKHNNGRLIIQKTNIGYQINIMYQQKEPAFKKKLFRCRGFRRAPFQQRLNTNQAVGQYDLQSQLTNLANIQSAVKLPHHGSYSCKRRKKGLDI